MIERLKRWGKGALALAIAWLGGFSEFPLGQYDAKPEEPEEEEQQP